MAGVSTLHDAFDQQATLTPHAVACVCRGKQRHVLTYSELCDRSRILEAGLTSRLLRDGVCSALPPVGVGHVLALQVPRTHVDFVPLLVAVSRVGIPFVLLSTDLEDKMLESERNSFIFKMLQPCLRVASRGFADSTATFVEDLGIDGSNALKLGSSCMQQVAPGATASTVFCYMFTGGTYRTKVVQLSHSMVVHERSAYHELWRPQTKSTAQSVRVLAHTSVYWGASALGQLSISLAYGGTAVWTEATEVAELQRCVREEVITVLGVVPDHLDLLAPQNPDTELPTIECVFTWGERLPIKVAERWRGHRLAQLFELLISTEYWLSLYARPLEGSTLRIVSGADTLVLQDDGRPAGVGEIGELCISGPMVTPGYLPIDGQPVPDVFLFTDDGKCYFRTRDLVRRVERGVIYKGRADMMAKDRGKWVDMNAIEDSILRLEGVQAAKVVPDIHHEHYHAFVVLDGNVGHILDAIRMVIPSWVQVWAVPQLVRHPVTRKVDVSRLLRAVPNPAPSWPLEDAGIHSTGHSSTCGSHQDPCPTPVMQANRLWAKIHRHAAWTLATFGVVYAVSDGEDLETQLTLMVAWLACCCAVLPRKMKDEGSGRPDRALALAAAWLVVAISIRPSVWKLVKALGHSMILTYTWLAFIYADDKRSTSTFARAVMLILDEIPFRKLGTFVTLSIASHRLPQPASSIALGMLLSFAVYGVVVALRSRRLLAWPVTFWVLGLGNQQDVECNSYLWTGAWQWHLEFWQCRCSKVKAYIVTAVMKATRPYASLQSFGQSLAPQEVTTNTNSNTATPMDLSPETCIQCLRPIEHARWPARDAGSNPLCDACGARMASEAQAEAAAWLQAKVFEPTTVHPVKRCSSWSRATGEHVSPDDDVCGTDVNNIAQESAVKRARTNSSTSSNEQAMGDKLLHDGHDEYDDERLLAGQSETYWWHYHTSDVFDISPAEESRLQQYLQSCSDHSGLRKPARGSEAASSVEHSVQVLSADEKLLRALVEQIEPRLKPVDEHTVLLGLDSLRVARLASAIRVQLGRSVKVSQLRHSRTFAELMQVVGNAEPVACEANADGVAANASNTYTGSEFAVWFSPGQYSPMGVWVLRSDKVLDESALQTAVQNLVQRHPATRTQIVDPMRYLSCLYDAAVLWTLFAPLVEASHNRLLQVFKKLVSWSLTLTWPRIRIFSREQIYEKAFPGTATPLTIVRNLTGQAELEGDLRVRKRSLQLPLGVTLFQLRCHLTDVWTYKMSWQHTGRFLIINRRCLPEVTQRLCYQGIANVSAEEVAGVSDLVYIDMVFGEWGVLISTLSPLWETPPYGFPAIYFVRLNSGAVVWFRMENAHELRIRYKADLRHTSRSYHFIAHRAAPRRELRDEDAIHINWLSICMLHAFADGNCFTPLANDLLSFYNAALKGVPRKDLVTCIPSFGELQKRLMDTLLCRSVATRSSLRGSIFRYNGLGYGHTLHLLPNTIEAISCAAAHYRVPLDVVLLAFLLGAKACADKSDLMEFTIYVPMRDGPAEAMMIGLFADWRDMAIAVDFELATVLGTVLQVSHAIQHRKWKVYNALRKPECTVINMQPLDVERKWHFHHEGENLWHGGDQLNPDEVRPSEMTHARQPATFNIEQQDETTWWIFIDAGYDQRPPPWMRRFVHGFGKMLHNFLFNPLAKVH